MGGVTEDADPVLGKSPDLPRTGNGKIVSGVDDAHVSHGPAGRELAQKQDGKRPGMLHFPFPPCMAGAAAADPVSRSKSWMRLL